MPTAIKTVREHNFIMATLEGELDLEEGERLLEEIMLASVPLVDYEIIIDTRTAQSVLSVTDLMSLTAELRYFRGTFSRKTAIVCPLERFGYAEFFAVCSRNRGLPIHAFTSFGDAIEWLIATK